ncbi:MAG: nitroreductase family protein [Paludibacteraceae bacterium]|nr:nitroreductase family protein [Paludibacteraceae bacterium]
MINSLKTRRTIRKYSDKEVNDTLLNSLLADAFRASNNGNMQTYSVVVTRSPEKKEKLAPLHFNQPCFKNAPVVLTFCADFRRFSQWCEASGAVPGYNNFLSFFSAATDALLVAQTFAVAAEDAGLGLCYLGTTNYNADGIIDALELPQLVFPITTITLGWPAETPAQPDRLDPQGLIHQETYKDVDVKALYAPKEALPEMQAFVKENGTKSLAHIFTDIRYTKPNNEFFSDALLKAIKRQGFMF